MEIKLNNKNIYIPAAAILLAQFVLVELINFLGQAAYLTVSYLISYIFTLCFYCLMTVLILLNRRDGLMIGALAVQLARNFIAALLLTYFCIKDYGSSAFNYGSLADIFSWFELKWHIVIMLLLLANLVLTLILAIICFRSGSSASGTVSWWYVPVIPLFLAALIHMLLRCYWVLGLAMIIYLFFSLCLCRWLSFGGSGEKMTRQYVPAPAAEACGPTACPVCGHELAPGEEFCPMCGAACGKK